MGCNARQCQFLFRILSPKTMNKKDTDFSNITFFSPEGFVPERYKDSADMYIAHCCGMDIRSVKKMLNGDSDFKLSTLNQVGKALNVNFTIVPCQKNSSFMDKVKFFGRKGEMFWTIPKNFVCRALWYLFRDAVISDEEEDDQEGLSQAFFRFTCVLIGCRRGGEKDRWLIRSLRCFMKKIFASWEMFMEEEKKEDKEKKEG